MSKKRIHHKQVGLIEGMQEKPAQYQERSRPIIATD